MAYYDALIAAWNSATQPPTGVTGTALTAGMTTAQKLAAVNAWTTMGPAPTIVYAPRRELLNAIVPADAMGLTAVQSTWLGIALGSDPVDVTTGSLPYQIMATIFAGKTTTLAQLVAVQSKYAAAPVMNWCAANGYPIGANGGNLSLPDCSNAGLV